MLFYKVKSFADYDKKNLPPIFFKMRNIYIHVIGIEGTGHHFWMSFIDELIRRQDEYKKGFHQQFQNPTISDVTRKYLQNITWGWNMYDKTRCLESRSRLDDAFTDYLSARSGWIIFHGDSYPTMHFRKTEENIDIVDFYARYNSIMDFKFIFINRDIFKAINSRPWLDGGLSGHAKNMLEHIDWISKVRRRLPSDVYIDTHYENIDVEAVEDFLPFENIRPVFNKVFKKSDKKVSESDYNTIKKIIS